MLESVLFPFEVLGILSFALSGAIEARRDRLDVVGVFFVAFATALGGGTLRDILINRRPLFWVEHEWYVIAILVLSLAMCFTDRLELPRWLSRMSDFFDSAGIGLFSVVGVGFGLNAGCGITTALLMGIITAIFGGVFRDVLCNRVPYVFQHTELCATCALAGGLVYVGLAVGLSSSQELALVLGAITGGAVRWLAVSKRIHLPI